MIKINDQAPKYVAQLQEAVRQYNALPMDKRDSYVDHAWPMTDAKNTIMLQIVYQSNAGLPEFYTDYKVVINPEWSQGIDRQLNLNGERKAFANFYAGRINKPDFNQRYYLPTKLFILEISYLNSDSTKQAIKSYPYADGIKKIHQIIKSVLPK